MKINRATTLLLAAASLVITQVTFAGDRSKCGDLQYENIYKHFVGTVGKDKVVLDLRWGYCGGSNNGGSFFYSTGTKDFRYLMISEPKSYAHDVLLTAAEYRIDDNWFSQTHEEVPRWDFLIKNGKLTGTWTSSDGKEKMDIDLTEDYSNATPLEIMTYADETKKKEALYGGPVQYSFIGVKPTGDVKKNEADFISNTMLQLANTDRVNAATWTDYPKAQARKDMSEYSAKQKEAHEKDRYAGYHKAYCHHSMFPMYNENGILVAEYLFFNDNKSGRTFRNIDVANKKILTSADIFIGTKDALTGLLRQAYNNVKAPENTEKLPVDRIVPTENLVITHNGIAFNYQQGSDCSSEVWLFLSYDQLKDVLTNNFKEKMKI